MNPNVRNIKRAQKESLLLRELSELFRRIIADEPKLMGLFVTRVRLSDDKSVCNILFHSQQGKDDFHEKMKILLLYKPSIRKSLSQMLPSRYTPELKFRYDEQIDKQHRVEELLHKIGSSEEE